MYLLEINNANIGIQEVLLEGVNLQLNGGKLVVIIGKNGSGKSTLLLTIAGILKTLTGIIKINGEKISELSFQQRAELIALVTTYRSPEKYMRVAELVAMGAEQNAKFEELSSLLKLMEIDAIAEKYTHQISDGEYQKANIARALAQQTPIVLLDEPSAFLDYDSKRKLFQNLYNLTIEKQKLILCVSHDLDSCKPYAHEFWHISNKQINISNKLEL